MRYLRLLGVQLRMSALLAAQYRYDFFVDAVISMFWTITAVVPLFVVYASGRTDVGGWSFGELLLVVGWFTLLQGVVEGAINPSLSTVVDHIRKGTLDFVLLKPADAQFLVSTARFLPWRISNLISGIVIFAYSFREMGRTPSMGDIALAALLFVFAVLLLYSLWIVTVSAAFYVVKIDNLTHLFMSVFDAARWPSTIFPRVVRWMFTVVVPLALMTTFPALAMRGKLGVRDVILAVLGAMVFAVVARAMWKRSIAKYTSASS
jgi:ABC-2 type transport system permease protein